MRNAIDTWPPLNGHRRAACRSSMRTSALVPPDPDDPEERFMNGFKHLALAVAAGVCFAVSAPKAEAQVSVDIGPEPDCPYGFYDYPPYDCAPSGYYGPDWFVGGIFIGAGPWFHGRAHFRGHVNNRFDGRHGYRGPIPNRGDSRDPAMHADHMAHFRGNEMRGGGGHAGGGRR
jgi:hypothetical protein